MFRRIAAAVVSLDDFIGDDFEVTGVVVDGAAERLFGGTGCGAVSVADGGVDIEGQGGEGRCCRGSLSVASPVSVTSSHQVPFASKQNRDRILCGCPRSGHVQD